MIQLIAAALIASAGIGTADSLHWSSSREQARDDTLLALETFDAAWTRIRDTYYDSTFRGLDWDAVRDELRSRAGAARNSTELRRVLEEMTARLGESHFAIIPAEANTLLNNPPGATHEVGGDVGLRLRLLGDEVVVVRADSGGSAWAAGVRPGWELQSVASTSVQEVVPRIRELVGSKLALIHIPRSLEAQLAGEPNSTVDAVFADHRGQSTSLTLMRRPTRGQAVTFGFLPTIIATVEHDRVERHENCVEVVRFNTWMAPIAAEIDRAIEAGAQCKGVVLDLRGNTGGLAGMVMGIAGHFLSRPDSLAAIHLRSNTIYLVANPRYSAAGGGSAGPRAGRLAIIIDEQSASTTEIFSAAMQHIGRARVFGTRSPGLALPATVFHLPNGDVLMHVIADLTLANGARVEGQGVTPEVEVPVSRLDLLAGRDAALEQALDWTFSTN